MHRWNLREVDSTMIKALKDFQAEFVARGEILFGAPELTSGMRVEEWLAYVELHKDKASLPEGRVLARTYLFIHPHHGSVLGLINIRLELNDYLLAYGGNIGYAVRPSERKKGYGTAMLRALVPIAHSLGLDRLLITCEEGNVASQRTIESCCGFLEDKRMSPDGKLMRRYWLTGLEC